MKNPGTADKEIARSRYEHRAEVARIGAQILAEHAFLGWKALPVLGGGAILALFTLDGNPHFKLNRAWMIISLGLFALTLFVWMLSILLGYRAQIASVRLSEIEAEDLYQEIAGNGGAGALDRDAYFKQGAQYLRQALAATVISVVLFGVGSLAAFVAVIVGR